LRQRIRILGVDAFPLRCILLCHDRAPEEVETGGPRRLGEDRLGMLSRTGLLYGRLGID